MHNFTTLFENMLCQCKLVKKTLYQSNVTNIVKHSNWPVQYFLDVISAHMLADLYRTRRV